MSNLIAVRKGDAVVITRTSYTNRPIVASSYTNRRRESKDLGLTSLLMPEQLRKVRRTTKKRKIDRSVAPSFDSKTSKLVKSTTTATTAAPLPVSKCTKELSPVIMTRSPSTSSTISIKSPKLQLTKPPSTRQIDRGTQVDRDPIGLELLRATKKICKITLPRQCEIAIASKSTERDQAPVIKSITPRASSLQISKSPSPTPTKIETGLCLDKTSIQNDATRPDEEAGANSDRISMCDDKKPPLEQQKQDKAAAREVMAAAAAAAAATTTVDDIGVDVAVETSTATSPGLKLNEKPQEPVLTSLPTPVPSRTRSPCPARSTPRISRPPSPPPIPKDVPSDCGPHCRDQVQAQVQLTHEQVILVVLMLLQALTLTLPTLILLSPPKNYRLVKK